MKKYKIKGHVSDNGYLNVRLDQFKGKDVFLTVMPLVDVEKNELVSNTLIELSETQKEELQLQLSSEFMQEYLNDEKEDAIWSKY